ncbi:PQQ-binding-like beta-propeller repeat protein, partial [Alloacidobacterium sp.]|uniref:outer membrane protein assembly factor BamB family protein n=1 Tax=Alloacidobacterium sp. TaxID=2951999 RepID=UPI002D6EDD81
MKPPLSLVNRKQTGPFRTVGLMLAMLPLWLMLATASTSANAQTTSSPGDWIEFHRDNMQRWNPYETALGVGNVGGLQVKWKNPIGIYGSGAESSPAIVNGVVYFGSDDSNVYALNASTGAKLWSYATDGPAQSSPAVVDGVVYIGVAGYSKSLYALNAATGALLWSIQTTDGFSMSSSPAVANGVVCVGSADGHMYGLDAKTGTILWSYHVQSPVFNSPAVAYGIVYIGSGDGNVYALNAATGGLVWRYTTGAPIESSPAVANRIVYIGSDDGNLYALNAGTGALVWKYPAYVFASPAVANGVVYIGSGIGATEGIVYALNASTGAKLWSNTIELPLLFSSPAVANGVLYIAGNSGIANIYALNASTGALLWSYARANNVDAIGTVISSPAIVNGVLYMRAGNPNGIGSGTGNVYAFSVGSADLFLRIFPSTTTVHQGDLLTFAFPVWNLGPDVAEGEVLSSLQVPVGTTFDYVRISGTPGLGTCTHPPYGGTGQIVCHEGDGMAPNTTWTVRLTVRVTAPAGTVITANAATMSDTPDPNLANNTATVSLT